MTDEIRKRLLRGLPPLRAIGESVGRLRVPLIASALTTILAFAPMAIAPGPAGDFIYRFGDPARYAQGDAPSIQADWTQATAGHKQIGGSHDIQWIKPGLPGAGNFLTYTVTAATGMPEPSSAATAGEIMS